MKRSALKRFCFSLAVTGVLLVSPLQPEEVGAWFVKDDPACPHSSDVPGAGEQARTARAIACLVNARRAEAGLAPLRANPLLTEISHAHAHAMVGHGFFGHVGPDGLAPEQRIAAAGYSGIPTAEEIAWGAGANAMPVRVVESWMASAARDDIFNPRLTEIGVGVALGSPDGGPDAEGTAYTVDLGAGSR